MRSTSADPSPARAPRAAFRRLLVLAVGVATVCASGIPAVSAAAAAPTAPAAAAATQRPAQPPNVLFIALDDMNDWTTLFDRSNPIRTPHLERLARRGVFFRRAYAPSPACNPSRSAILTGVRPHRSGVYNNASDWRAAPVEGIVTLQQHFKNHGWFVAGAGKIFHHHDNWRFHDNASFHEFLMMRINEPYPPRKLNGLDSYGSRNTDWGPWPERVEELADHRTIDYAKRFLARRHEQPFFLNVGIYRPHSPFFAPRRWFTRYPLDRLVMPVRRDGDLDDVPAGARAMLAPTDWFWAGMQRSLAERPGAYREFVQAYQAVSSFADDMVGELMAALDASPYGRNTIVVLWSDHGFHVGEKDRIEKFALWEKTTRVPFIVVVPDVTRPGQVVDAPVDLMTIYPTLVELAGLARPAAVDGISLVPLLRGERMELPPALMSYQQGNHAVRVDRWRYIRYADGSEELYDLAADPHEWTNLAGSAEHRDMLERLRPLVPARSAPPVPELQVRER